MGSEIVRQLIDRGDEVVGFSRGHYADLEQRGMQSRRGDLADARALTLAAADCHCVVHTAAIAGISMRRDSYHQTNTIGTRNVIAACRENGIRSLVFSSSPSVTFDGEDQSGCDESVPYPKKFLCHYQETKAIAEQEVLASNSDQLQTIALRPHLLWGPNDPHLFPRLVARARSGRLRCVGDGNNLIDAVHVTNAAHAHVLAVDRLAAGDSAAAGSAYFITNDEPVPCWEWIETLLSVAEIKIKKRQVSLPFAWRVGQCLEIAYRVLRLRGEPPMTRFLAAQLAREHYFDISAAKERLGYRPNISMSDGIAALRQAQDLRSTAGAN
ncbi:MAG: NAD-dependent epimerase/dehydratase family protein [Planctomycetota bacterium]